ncbi:MAG: hypothetical protein ACYC46_12680 [Acidobacteriaceae bacterium]
MADLETVQDSTTTPQPTDTAELLIHISPHSQESLRASLSHVREGLMSIASEMQAIVTYAEFETQTAATDTATNKFADLAPIQVAPYTLLPNQVPLRWIHTAPTYLAALKKSQQCGARACVMLGSEIDSLSPGAITALIRPVLEGNIDLAMPVYTLDALEGLLNSAILYPLTRALYSRRVRYPLGLDLVISARFQEHLLTSTFRKGTAEQEDALLWPATEAAVNGFQIAQVEVGHRRFSPPESADLSSVLTQIVGSLFADVDARAAYWQKMRQVQIVPSIGEATKAEESSRSVDVKPMIDSFKLGLGNLHEIWSIVLPPNTLLALKKLDRMPEDAFHMPDSVWVRIVYDFALTYRLRNINRKHLLGALTPLYLGWAASYVLDVMKRGHAIAEERIQALALAFEVDKPYLVSRWRWPDRFNP